MNFEVIKSALEILPGENAHWPLMPINRPFSSDALSSVDLSRVRKSAVGLHLFPFENQFKFALIQRPPYEGSHGGQISFPGGKIEDSDPSLEFTARRESFEEIGLPIHQGTCLGTLTEVYIPVSNFLISPFVFAWDTQPDFVLDPREVESLILMNTNALIAEETLVQGSIAITKSIKRKDVPHFLYEGHQIWGATAMILSEFKAVINKL